MVSHVHVSRPVMANSSQSSKANFLELAPETRGPDSTSSRPSTSVEVGTLKLPLRVRSDREKDEDSPKFLSNDPNAAAPTSPLIPVKMDTSSGDESMFSKISLEREPTFLAPRRSSSSSTSSPTYVPTAAKSSNCLNASCTRCWSSGVEL